MPRNVTPAAVTTNVTAAASRCAGSVTADASAAASAPSSARPATAVTSTGGDRRISAVASPAPRPSTASPTPAVTEATQRRPGSGSASGPAARAALIAARFTACPPNGAAASVPSPVATRSGPSRGRYPYVASTAIPGTFCDAIVTRNRGTPPPPSVAGSNRGAVHTRAGARSPPPAPVPVSTIPATAATSAAGTAHGRAKRPTTAHTTTTGTASAGTSATAFTGATQIGSSTPASIAPAIGGGITSMSRPSGRTRPDSTISTPHSRNAPTPPANPPPGRPPAPRSAPPGADHPLPPRPPPPR